MGKILLIDVDKVVDPKLKVPDLALMQVSTWEKTQGNEVRLIKEHWPHLTEWPYDKVYISCIFTKNKERAKSIARSFPTNTQISTGGTGFEYTHDWLPEAIQKVKPDYDLYPSTYSQGFTTRGCIRLCEWCAVPQKEGPLQIWQHPSEFHDDRFDTCMLMDNNLFAASFEWQVKIFKWFRDTGVKMIDHGFDARLLNETRVKLLKSVKHKGLIHFAWDTMGDEAAVIQAINLLHGNFDLRRKILFYVLCGYNTTFEQDVYRCQKLKSLGVQAFVMRYTRSPQINALYRWTSRSGLFWKFDFKDYTRKKNAPIRN